MSTQTKSPGTVSDSNTLVGPFFPADTYPMKPVRTYVINSYTPTFRDYIGYHIVGQDYLIPAQALVAVLELATLKGSGLTSGDQIALGAGRIQTPNLGECTWLDPDNAKVSDNVYATAPLIEDVCLEAIHADDWSNPKPTGYYTVTPYNPCFRCWMTTWTLGGRSQPAIVQAEITKMETAKGSGISVTDINKVGSGKIFCPVFSETSHYLKATNFGFTIPTGVIITGIKVEIEQMGAPYLVGETPSTSIISTDSEIRIVNASGVIGTVNQSTGAVQPASDTYITYDSQGRQFGQPWTPADINDADFGVVYSVKGLGTVSVDHIQISVDYLTTPSPFPSFYQ